MCTNFQREGLGMSIPCSASLRDQTTPRHAIIYARILCCEIVPVKAGAVERERPRLRWGTVSKTALGLAETMEIKRQRRPYVSQTSWADRIDPAAGFRGTVGPQSPTAAALVVVAALCRE